jgi:hypothetical protein
VVVAAAVARPELMSFGLRTRSSRRPTALVVCAADAAEPKKPLSEGLSPRGNAAIPYRYDAMGTAYPSQPAHLLWSHPATPGVVRNAG